MTEQQNRKGSYVGAPAIFALEQCCLQLNDAFPESWGCYLVGSSIERANWRDIDVRMIMPDDAFERLFPNAHGEGRWEFDPRWTLLTVAISERMAKVTGLPIDFQIQPATFANALHKKPRHALGLRYVHKDPALTADEDP